MTKKKTLAYFYATYSFTDKNGTTGTGAITFNTPYSDLNLKDACILLQNKHDLKTVFLLNWQKITKKQYQDWNQLTQSDDEKI